MKFVKPKVDLIAQTQINELGLSTALRDMYASWETDTKLSLNLLPEVAGRACYRSWKPGLNPNVTKVREGNQRYLGNIIRQKHGSVFEHASMTFWFQNVSRVFTHELVRHRAGCSVSQESLRYVRLDDLDFVDPMFLYHPEPIDPYLNEPIDPYLKKLVEEYVKECENFQQDLITILKVNEKSFKEKKRFTSWMRRFAPIGLATSIVWTVNLRALRHIIPLRTSVHAEVEIRHVFNIVAEFAKQHASNVFQDMTKDKDGQWIVESEKI